MNHKQLMQQVAEMKSQMDNYKGELDNLRNQVSAYENVENPIATNRSSITSRRRMLKNIGLGVAGFGAVAAAGAFNSTQALAAPPDPSQNAIEATSGATGYAVSASSAYAPIYMTPNGVPGAPTASGRQTGELLVDSGGNLYFNVAGSTTNPSTFRKLASANTYGNSNSHIQPGSYFLLPSSDRFVDSRGLNGVPLGRPISTMASAGGGGAGYVTNPLTNTPGRSTLRIPTGATAVVGNVTVIVRSGSFSGAIKILPGNTSQLSNGTGVIAFSGSVSDLTFSNSFSCPLAPDGTLEIALYSFTGTNFNADVIIDVVGYYF